MFRGKYKSRQVIDCVRNELNLSKDDFIDIITNYRYQEIDNDNNSIHKIVQLKDNALNYKTCNIITIIPWSSDDISLQALIGIVGETEIGKLFFVRDGANNTILENGIRRNKSDIIDMIVSMSYVQNIYQSQSYWTYRLFWWYENVKFKNKNLMFKNIIKHLGLTKEMVIKLLKNYQYKEKNDNLNFVKKAVKCVCTHLCNDMNNFIWCFLFFSIQWNYEANAPIYTQIIEKLY